MIPGSWYINFFILINLPITPGILYKPSVDHHDHQSPYINLSPCYSRAGSCYSFTPNHTFQVTILINLSSRKNQSLICPRQAKRTILNASPKAPVSQCYSCPCMIHHPRDPTPYLEQPLYTTYTSIHPRTKVYICT